MASTSEPPASGERMDRLMVWGAAVTVLGMLLTLIAMLPLLIPSLRMPSIWWALAMVTGVGLGMFCLGFWRAARRRSMAVSAAVADIAGTPTSLGAAGAE